MPEISFTVNGAPQGKGRPRMTNKGFVYTPKRTKEYERAIAMAAGSAMQAAMQDKAMGPVEVCIEVFGGIFPSWSYSRKRECFGEPWCGTPDADNIAKAILDGCNGIIWRDDAQVWSLQVIKVYDDTHRVLVSASW
jgi:Holliday junction resolvase RusA-like endonuclease